MCFTKEVTMAMMAINLGTALLLQARGLGFRRYQIFYVFFIMEAIQLVQYMTLDDCGHWLNQWSTILAYAHIAFQPVSINYYIFGWEPNRDMVKTIVRLCIVGGTLFFIRLPLFGVSQFLSEHLTWMGHEWPDISLAGTAAACGKTSTMCGPQLCARSGIAHLRWELPLLPTSYFLPGPFFHFFVFFMPSLVAPGQFHRDRLLMVIFSFLLGPPLAMAWTYAKAGDAYGTEWPALWCAYSGVQCFLALFWEFGMGLGNPLEVGSAENQRYAAKVKRGLLFDQSKVLPGASAAPGLNLDVTADASTKWWDQQHKKRS